MEQAVEGIPKPLAFFSAKLTPTERKYSAYDRELLAIYRSILHYRHFLEGRHFTIFTDHKPLVYAFHQKPEKCSPRQSRQLDLISQYTTDIQYVIGFKNTPADTLSRISEISKCTFDYDMLATSQETDGELKTLLQDKKFTFQQFPSPGGNKELWFETSHGNRLYIPAPYRKNIIEITHNLSHSGVRNSVKQVTRR